MILPKSIMNEKNLNTYVSEEQANSLNDSLELNTNSNINDINTRKNSIERSYNTSNKCNYFLIFNRSCR